MLRRNIWRFSTPPLAELRKARAAEVERLAEMVQAKNFVAHVKDLGQPDSALKSWKTSPLYSSGRVSSQDILSALDASFLTFFLHVESRIASLLGCGFYTIGPCGEELLSPIGMHLKTTDPMALHYRHLAVNIGRQVKLARPDSSSVLSLDDMKRMAIGRAKGYTVASSDPVCGGRHCALGGSVPHDYLVTSTLASQICPAVGRAMGGSLARLLGHPPPFGDKDYLSFVSTGDGSTNNGHFLSGLNLAKFATYRKYRVPLLICVTDNNLCISLKTEGYFSKKFAKDMGIPIFQCQGDDIIDVWETSAAASEFVRGKCQPAGLVISEITRRFGHAATDRQAAYLSQEEIQAMQSNNDVLGACEQAVAAGLTTSEALVERLNSIWDLTRAAFEEAHTEEKINHRNTALLHTHSPFVPMPSPAEHQAPESHRKDNILSGSLGVAGSKSQVLRKHMNNVFDQVLGEEVDGKPSDVVYTGEDVTHGGYYLVTDGLSKKHELRIADFPPDETSLVGVGMGYAQCGLTPIVEIPYAKYLDCGFDMFTEACIMNWLSKGTQPNGMIFRLQGFGRGVFGGNYHTHNMLCTLPGLDTVCYSNGPEYANAMRYAVQQARNGRVVMFVDCTELLNIREIPSMFPLSSDDKEYTHCVGSWEFPYSESHTYRTFDDVTVYRDEKKKDAPKKLLMVSYGGGMISALQATNELRRRVANGIIHGEDWSVDVVDCQLLSDVPTGLRALCSEADAVLFADMCKEGQNPLAGHITKLMSYPGASPYHRSGAFKDANCVRSCTALKTYNPLGNTLTFLSADDILTAATELVTAH